MCNNHGATIIWTYGCVNAGTPALCLQLCANAWTPKEYKHWNIWALSSYELVNAKIIVLRIRTVSLAGRHWKGVPEKLTTWYTTRERRPLFKFGGYQKAKPGDHEEGMHLVRRCQQVGESPVRAQSTMASVSRWNHWARVPFQAEMPDMIRLILDLKSRWSHSRLSGYFVHYESLKHVTFLIIQFIDAKFAAWFKGTCPLY